MLSNLSQDTRFVYTTAKNARVNIEEETRLIENRIRMIKFEEERALKRIQETREKIEEVYKARTRFVENRHHRSVAKEKEMKSLSEIKEAVRSNRMFHQEKMNYTQLELVNAKQTLGKRVRGWKEYIKRTLQQQVIDQKRYNRKMKEAVKISNQQGNMRIKLLQDINEQKARHMYNKRVEMEKKRKEEIDERVMQLGREEQMLMERVANIHEVQRKTVEELEKIYN